MHAERRAARLGMCLWHLMDSVLKNEEPPKAVVLGSPLQSNKCLQCNQKGRFLNMNRVSKSLGTKAEVFGLCLWQKLCIG